MPMKKDISRRHKWPLPLAAMTVVAISLAGCSSSTGKPAATTQGNSSSSSSSAGDILIGFANNEGSTGLSIPEYRFGAEAAVKYINSTGGVNGKQLKLLECTDSGSPETAVSCANQFVSAHAVAYVAGIDVGADSAIPIISGAGVPYVTEFPWGTVQRTSPDAFALGAGDTAFFSAPLTALQKSGAKVVADFYYDIPTSQQLLPLAKGLAAQDGMKLVPIGVSATSPDWTSAVASAQASNADAMWGILQEGDCTSLVRSARTAGFTGPISVGSCSAYFDTLGTQAANTLATWPFYFPQMRSEAPPAIQAQIDTYVQAMGADGHADIVNGYATASFSMMMTLAEVMKGISGSVTATSLLGALKTANVPGFMGPAITCGTKLYSTEPVACNAKVLLIKVVAENGKPVRTLLQPGFVDTATGDRRRRTDEPAMTD
jgi:branched-chain amino acid transport system substrate-binding protein